ncbi:MAG TPA: hypothetical protein VFR58_11285 [Flavisolibacter sp.]|nr:hypothetical protein [Flavisolibacter sp.]
MIKGITKDKHFITDYSYAPLAWMAPKIGRFEDVKWASNLCRALSLGAVGYSLLTDAKWGAVKLIPYKTHTAIDIGVGVFTIAAPWVFKVANKPRARNTLLIMGLTSVVVGILSWIGSKNS